MFECLSPSLARTSQATVRTPVSHVRTVARLLPLVSEWRATKRQAETRKRPPSQSTWRVALSHFDQSQAGGGLAELAYCPRHSKCPRVPHGRVTVWNLPLF